MAQRNSRISETLPSGLGWTGRSAAVAVGIGVGFIAGATKGLLNHRQPLGVASPFAAVAEPDACSPTPVAPVATRYEWCARVVWSDAHGHGTSDLEDTEGIEMLLSEGWELVKVIVPFAQTNQLVLSYPGNTRKLIAYYRRPIGGQEG